LILGGIGATADLITIGPVCDARVVTARNKVRVQFMGHIEQPLPLHAFIA